MSDGVVVDASLAIKWVLEEPHSAEAGALLNGWAEAGNTLLAPALFLYEVANVLTKRIERKQLTLAQAKERLRFFLESGPLLRQIPDVHTRALELADHFRLPTSYDAHYLALAELQSCDFWTADERLFNSVKRELKWVHWLGERKR
ncbi:MAG: type II toxin-antitoxin system VapC family toxin [Candidatus Binataceae bacterium]